MRLGTRGLCAAYRSGGFGDPLGACGVGQNRLILSSSMFEVSGARALGSAAELRLNPLADGNIPREIRENVYLGLGVLFVAHMCLACWDSGAHKKPVVYSPFCTRMDVVSDAEL